jgi:hypothetical protein
VPQALGYFKEVEKHAFTLSHCCLKLKDYEKWKASFVLWYKDGKRTAEDNEQESLGKAEHTRTGQEATGQARLTCAAKLPPLH